MKTDVEIAIAALTDWPVEARPPVVQFGPSKEFPKVKCLCDGYGHDFIDHHAIALFVASGLAFVIDNGLAVWQSDDDGQFRCGRWNSTETFDGPTLLAALDSAIRTTHGGK